MISNETNNLSTYNIICIDQNNHNNNKMTQDDDHLMGDILVKNLIEHNNNKMNLKPNTNTNNNDDDNIVRCDRKIQLNFSVDRLLGINTNSYSNDNTNSIKNDQNRPDMTNNPAGYLINHCSPNKIGYDCCKYITEVRNDNGNLNNGLILNNLSFYNNTFENCSNIMDIKAIVRPTPIRVAASRINTTVLTNHLPSSSFNSIQQFIKYPSSVGSLTQTNLNQFKTNDRTTQSFHEKQTTTTNGGKRKRSWSRAVFSNLQRKGLEIQFQIQKYITKPDRRKLAARLNLTDAQVKVWFQNRRMKWRHTRENLKSGQEKPIEECSNNGQTEDPISSSDEDEIDVVAE